MKALTTANKFLRKPVVKQATRILLILLILTAVFCIPVFAEGTTSGGADKKDIWKAGEDMIKDVYNHIATISTALAALMSAVAVIGAKLSNNQHKVDAGLGLAQTYLDRLGDHQRHRCLYRLHTTAF